MLTSYHHLILLQIQTESRGIYSIYIIINKFLPNGKIFIKFDSNITVNTLSIGNKKENLCLFKLQIREMLTTSNMHGQKKKNTWKRERDSLA